MALRVTGACRMIGSSLVIFTGFYSEEQFILPASNIQAQMLTFSLLPELELMDYDAPAARS